MDRLTLLSCFVRVAESGSFSAAAHDLKRTQSAVSQQIRALETRLRVRLFDRTTRKVSLTKAGVRYLQNAKIILEMLDEADATVGDLERTMSGKLKISAPVSFGTTVLGSYLFSFRQTYPDLQLDVSLSDQFTDVVAEGLDLSIRLGSVTDPNLVVRKIGVVERCLAATPGYLNRAGRPAAPEELEGHDYVVHSNVRGGEHFSLITADGRIADVHVKPVFRSDNSQLICEAIASGLGIGLIHGVLLTPKIASGALERVLPNWNYEPQHVHAIYPSSRYIPPKVRVFVDGFAEYLREVGALI